MIYEQLSLLEPIVPADRRCINSCPGEEQPRVPAEVADLERRWAAKYDEWHELSVLLYAARSATGGKDQGHL